MLYSEKTVCELIHDIRTGKNKSFAEWMQYGIDKDEFIAIVHWMAEETQEERQGHLSWARAVGLVVPHQYIITLGGNLVFRQTGPAKLIRIRNNYLDGIGLAICWDNDTDEMWLYHSWPHLTMQDLMDQKVYSLENSTHPHPELSKYVIPDSQSEK